MSEFPDHPFWTFSTRHYGRGGVAAACLSLQTRRQIDVNILLFCIWAAMERGRRLSEDEMGRLTGAADDWHAQVVRPLRAARQRMKAGAAGLADGLVEKVRKRVIAAEIECEHIEQLVLAGALEEGEAAPEHGAGEAAARRALANVACYFRAFGLAPDAGDAEDLAAVLRPLAPGLSASAAARMLAGG